MKRKLTPEQVGKVWKSMPGGVNRFMKDWGPQAFADALIEEFNRSSTPEVTPQSMAGDTMYMALRARAQAAGFRSVAHALDAAVAYKNAESSGEALQFATPANHWSGKGEPDPHGTSYDCERAELTLGHYADDELANGAFMNYDRVLSFDTMVNPKEGQFMPIVWMTAVKDRIRWLSRALVRKSKYANDLKVALASTVKELQDLNASFHRDGEWPAVTTGKAALALKDDDVIDLTEQKRPIQDRIKVRGRTHAGRYPSLRIISGTQLSDGLNLTVSLDDAQNDMLEEHARVLLELMPEREPRFDVMRAYDDAITDCVKALRSRKMVTNNEQTDENR